MSALTPYARLLRRPHFARMAVSAAAAFLPFGMLPLALVLFAHDATGSYASAGVIAGAANVGRALFSPGRARSVDRHGPARVLPILGVAYVAAIAVLVAAASAGAGTVVLALLAVPVGAAPPPVNATLRSVWTALVEPDERQTAYAIGTLIGESAFITSPLLTALVVSVASPTVALWASAILMLLATLAFASSAPVRAHAGSQERHPVLSALRSPGMRALLLTVVAFAAAFGALDIAAPAFAGSHGNRALGGVLLAALSIGVVVGTVAYGTRRPARSAAARYPGSCALAAGGMALMLLGMSIPDMTVWMALAGLALAPATTCGYLVLAELAETNRMTEATAWFSSAASAGPLPRRARRRRSGRAARSARRDRRDRRCGGTRLGDRARLAPDAAPRGRRAISAARAGRRAVAPTTCRRWRTPCCPPGPSAARLRGSCPP